jgi:hypothetical protein
LFGKLIFSRQERFPFCDPNFVELPSSVTLASSESCAALLLRCSKLLLLALPSRWLGTVQTLGAPLPEIERSAADRPFRCGYGIFRRHDIGRMGRL